jgi:MSHA biogenesis protein MshM
MFLQHFGLKQAPLGKNSPFLAHDDFDKIKEGFTHLLHAPGIGLLTGEAGVGKTATLRQITSSLNPHQYAIFYLSETQFTSFDIYRQIAQNLGLLPNYRFAQLWRDIKNQIRQMLENKRCLPIFIIDEAQNLPLDFFRGFPSFLNFNFDAKDMMTVWFVGYPSLSSILDRSAYNALASRIQMRFQLQPIMDRDQFKSLISNAFKEAGAQASLLTDSGIELIRMSSKGRPRYAHNILLCVMQIAYKKGLSFLPDDLIHEAIIQLKG